MPPRRHDSPRDVADRRASKLRAIALTCFACTLVRLPCAAQATTREDVDPRGLQANGDAHGPAVSDDGRYFVFSSDASNLVAGDANGASDIFLRDRATGGTLRVSVATGGGEAHGASTLPSLSADGRIIGFSSAASDLVALDANGVPDAFVHDAASGVTTRISVAPNGADADARSTGVFVSASGRWVGFSSRASNLIAAGDSNGVDDAYLRDLVLGTTVRVSVASSGVEGDGASLHAGLSDDGRFAVFQSLATNLVPLDTNGVEDAFVRDLVLGTTARVSVGSSFVEADARSFRPRISGDGRWITFLSAATNLVPSDTNGVDDAFLHELATGALVRVSVGSNGEQANAASLRCAVSRDGRFVAFDGPASTLVQDDVDGASDVFVRDLATSTTSLASVGWGGDPSLASGENPEFSGDARFLAFQSAPGLDGVVLGDDNGFVDAFVVDRALAFAAPTRYCTAKANSLGCVPRIAHSGAPLLGGADEFFVTATGVLSNKSGLFFFGASSASLPFGGGTLCVQPPLVRTNVANSLGGVTLDCSGSYSFHFTQMYAVAHGVAAGTTLHGQFWSRDPGFSPPQNVGLTDALRFTFAP
ncbi:MAG: PD40 domain-containing protein [Planctomycetes bacterium]|nr:PD40 domain-containing protein [Planctomycetota bacterium]